MLQPVIDARLRPGPVIHRIGANQKIVKPRIGFGFILRLLEMIQGFMNFLDRPKWTFDLTGRAGAMLLARVLASGKVRSNLDAEVAHHALKYFAAGDRAAIHVQHARHAMHRQIGRRLCRHRVEREAQSTTTSSP
ncbi:hypothetical protein [Burkholderia cepacia]|uniref:hypothetical protein n=1 Tax=Burkholderia cepacia TaxID=292 RepID=UPI001CC3BB5F|nr:hypothetical protein [Burkholderia cepacia]